MCDDILISQQQKLEYEQMHNAEKSRVKQLGEHLGYGRIMQLAQECWRDKLIKRNMGIGGEFAYGPCVVFTVPCGCTSNNYGYCEWCCGSQWLTAKVKAIKDAQENKS